MTGSVAQVTAVLNTALRLRKSLLRLHHQGSHLEAVHDLTNRASHITGKSLLLVPGATLEHARCLTVAVTDHEADHAPQGGIDLGTLIRGHVHTVLVENIMATVIAVRNSIAVILEAQCLLADVMWAAGTIHNQVAA